jgi:two-component system sensor histidine kinase HydH
MKPIALPVLLKKFLPFMWVIAVTLTLLIGMVGYATSRRIQETITRQFNQQQLILARKISDHVQQQIYSLRNVLLSLRDIWELNGAASRKLFAGYRQILGGDVLAILVLDPQGTPVWKIQNPEWDPRTWPRPAPASLAAYRGPRPAPDRIWIGQTSQVDGRWILPLAVPFRRSGDDPGGPPGGAIVLVLDAVRIARNATAGVVSGRTGYAWVINPQGILLDHFEQDFVGRSIFEVRKARNPHLSYQLIDDLTREALLKKQEGTSRYFSGWHRHRQARIEKLIAYTPILFYEIPKDVQPGPPQAAGEFWSVALVAPIEEVSGMIRGLNIQQFLLIGIFQLLIIIGTGLFVYISNRWSSSLAAEVDRKAEELKKSQEKLIHAERLAAVGSMASHVSHEIKNPLIAVGGLAQQLKRSPNLTDKDQHKLELIIGEIRRLETMLVEVRDFTRPTTPQKRKAALTPLIREITALFAPVLQEKRIECQTRLDPRLPEFDFDPDQLKQVLMNLVKNAVEAMPDGGRLSIRTAQEKGQALVEIADTGEGIEKENLTQLFRPFYTTKKKGTGLGLAVSSKIVHDHNGDITVESEEGRGTRVLVQLPLVV